MDQAGGGYAPTGAINQQGSGSGFYQQAGDQQQQQFFGGQQQPNQAPFADVDMTMQQQQDDRQPLQQAFAPPGQAGDPTQQANMWQDAFFKLAAAAGVRVDPATAQGASPEAIIQQAQQARHKDPWVQSQAREAAMQVQAAVLTAQNVHLRRELGSGWAAADSNMIQVQQLILDPAIEHEFKHLRTQLALRVAETEAAKAAYEGQKFTSESKNGHALLRKVKVLAEENEDLGRQQRESKQAAQGAIAAVERRHADELREELQDARDLCAFYQQENEELNMAAALYQRQVEVVRQQFAVQPQPVPDRDYGRDWPAANRDRDRDSRDRPLPPPRDRDRDRARGTGAGGAAAGGGDRPRDLRTAAAERSSRDRDGRDREGADSRAGGSRGDDKAKPSSSGYDMDRGRGGGYGGRGGAGRGRGRNLSSQYKR